MTYMSAQRYISLIGFHPRAVFPLTHALHEIQVNDWSERIHLLSKPIFNPGRVINIILEILCKKAHYSVLQCGE